VQKTLQEKAQSKVISEERHWDSQADLIEMAV